MTLVAKENNEFDSLFWSHVRVFTGISLVGLLKVGEYLDDLLHPFIVALRDRYSHSIVPGGLFVRS